MIRLFVLLRRKPLLIAVVSPNLATGCAFRFVNGAPIR